MNGSSKKYLFSSVLLVCLVGLGIFRYQSLNSSKTFYTVYGPIHVHEPVLLDLINSSAVQRLKKIHQYGPIYNVGDANPYSRYDHSMGVFAVLRKRGCSLKEQIAGLLHDASHTVFSHVGDHFATMSHSDRPKKKYKESKNSYQDAIHRWTLERHGIGKMLAKYDMKLDDIMHKGNNFNCLECDLPDMCADRIEYNLQGGLIRGLISQEDMEKVYANLRYKNDTWFFTNPEHAKQFANLSLNMTEKLWSTGHGLYLYELVSQMMMYAVEVNMISIDDVHFSYDNHMWDILTKSDDEFLQQKTREVLTYKQRTSLGDKKDHDIHLTGKFRGIDPLVKVEDNLVRLSSLDEDFSQEYHRVKKVLDEGWYVKVKNNAQLALASAQTSHQTEQNFERALA